MLSPAALAALGLNHGFSPSTVGVGQPSTLTVNLLNGNTAAATGTAGTVPLAAGLNVTNLATTCGSGTVNLMGGNLVLANGTVPATGSCTITATVTSSTSGTYRSEITVGAIASSQGANDQASNTALRVNVLSPIVGAKAFNPTSVAGGAPAAPPSR